MEIWIAPQITGFFVDKACHLQGLYQIRFQLLKPEEHTNICSSDHGLLKIILSKEVAYCSQQCSNHSLVFGNVRSVTFGRVWVGFTFLFFSPVIYFTVSVFIDLVSNIFEA